MYTTAKLVGYDGGILILSPSDPLDRELLQKNVEEIEIRLNDGRKISTIQRRKIFAIVRDIAMWSGHEPEYIRTMMTWEFVGKMDIEHFSLSDVDMTTAKELINYIIEFCLSWDVPTQDTLLKQCDDIGKYLYLCLEYRKCAICNKPAEVHHVDVVGMGRNRDEIAHIGMRAMALCRIHHDEAHRLGNAFHERYHVHGVELDEYLCKKLKLKATDEVK